MIGDDRRIEGGARIGALDQDLVASATSGPPGTVVTLSSASCTPSGDQEAYLDAQLFSGIHTGGR